MWRYNNIVAPSFCFSAVNEIQMQRFLLLYSNDSFLLYAYFATPVNVADRDMIRHNP